MNGRILIRSDQTIHTREDHWVIVFFFSALLHRPHKAAGYAVPTATAPLRGLLHCVACVAMLKKENIRPVGDSDLESRIVDCLASLLPLPRWLHVSRR